MLNARIFVLVEPTGYFLTYYLYLYKLNHSPLLKSSVPQCSSQINPKFSHVFLTNSVYFRKPLSYFGKPLSKFENHLEKTPEIQPAAPVYFDSSQNKKQKFQTGEATKLRLFMCHSYNRLEEKSKY